MTPRRKHELEKILEVMSQVTEVSDKTACLREIGFATTQRVAESLVCTLQQIGSDDTAREHLAALIHEFVRAPDPDGALINFLRYVDAAGTPSVLVDTVVAGKPIREILAAVFGTSQYMSDIIIRNTGYLYWLIEKQTWDRDDTREDYIVGLEAGAANFQSIDGKLNSVRRFQRRALLKIGVRDLLGLDGVEETTLRLSRLADAVVEVVLRILWDQLCVGAGTNPGFSVLAMGKLGGAELNYSSDIDLIYLCEDADDATIELYHKLARRLTTALSDVSAEGYLYRVDLRLRPDGDVGPIVNPVAAMLIYYENRGRPWEFQAMLKARVIAGDIALGERFLGDIGALTFSSTLSYSPLDTIAAMRRRIRDNISTRDRSFNIKLMEGGIRDIEFIVQALQLMHGGKYPDIRTPNTARGIETASQKKLFRKTEGKSLINAYRFFRLVEHRLQMMHQLKTHSLPESKEEIGLLAGRVSRGPLGEFTPQRFLSTLTGHINKVRLLSDGFFAGDDERESELLMLLPDEELTCETLERYNFNDAKHAASVLQSLAHGTFPDLADRQTRGAFQELLPMLLDEVAKTANPNQALVSFAAIAGATRNKRSFYESLTESPPFRALIRDVIGTSPLLARKLAASFDVLDSLRDNPARLTETPLPNGALWRRIVASASQSVRDQIRLGLDRKTLAAWITDIDRGVFPRGMSRTLAGAARDIVRGACAAVFENDNDVAVFALGSFGIGEPRLASDLDLLVVARGGDLEPVTRRIHTLNRIVTEASLFKLDFRLRGEGASAPLVQDVAYYESYFATRMSPWERIAFAKCAHWYGEPALASRFTGALRPYLTAAPDRSVVESLTATRGKLEALVPQGAERLETKRSMGARYDIEYLCALALALAERPYPLDANTKERLRSVAAAGLITEPERQAIDVANELYQRVDYLIELAGLSLPRTPERTDEVIADLDKTLELLGMPIEGGVDRALRNAKTGVRAIYDRFIATLRDRLGDD